MMKKYITRNKLIDMYISMLEEDKIPWRQRWVNESNVNGLTNREYKGINQLMLRLISEQEKYKDNRWFTYVQIKERGYKLNNASSKGVPIEYWGVYDNKNKKSISVDKYNEIISKNPELKDNYNFFCNTSYVFNGDLIEGLAPRDKLKNQKKEPSKFINNIIKNINVKYEEKGDKAYYSPSEDKVVLPNSDKFFDIYSYYATQLHELCHASGHKSRLNREFNIRDKKEYAKEELIAEISSSFLMEKVNIPVNAEHIDNHKAYIQSWLSILKDKPDELFKAINESTRVADYMCEKEKIKDKLKLNELGER